MKKGVWIPLLSTGCALFGAVVGAAIALAERDRQMDEYHQMVFDDSHKCNWSEDAPENAGAAGDTAPAGEAKPEAAGASDTPAEAPQA